MIRIGVIGLGMMGRTHLDVYAGRDDVQVVAVADANPDRLSGKEAAAGNIDGQAAGGFDLSRAKQFEDGRRLIEEADVDIIDVCVPTPGHFALGKAALEAGKHLLIEKPMCRTAAEAWELATLAEDAGVIAMPAMCMRFWPGWDWLREVIRDERYGLALSASFTRLCSHPEGAFYADGQANGGALLDLHIHDADFIHYCFGLPARVRSEGYRVVTSAIDHVVTTYEFDQPDAPQLVTAEGNWTLPTGFPFTMRYCINFEQAMVGFDNNAPSPVMVHQDGSMYTIDLPSGMGYAHEIDYFLRCVTSGEPPQRVTMRDGAIAVAIVEAEAQSITNADAVAIAV